MPLPAVGADAALRDRSHGRGPCAAELAGIALPVGARVMAQAALGEVLVSSTVKGLVSGSDESFAGRERRPWPTTAGEDFAWHTGPTFGPAPAAATHPRGDIDADDGEDGRLREALGRRVRVEGPRSRAGLLRQRRDLPLPVDCAA